MVDIVKNNAFYSCGDRVCVPIVGIENMSNKPVENLKVSFKTPKGLILDPLMYSLPKGHFDVEENIWYIGTLEPYEKFHGGDTPTFCYNIADHVDQLGNVVDIDTYDGKVSSLLDGSCFLPFEWNFKIYNDCTNCKVMSQTYCAKIDGVGCCQVERCLKSGVLNCESLTY